MNLQCLCHANVPAGSNRGSTARREVIGNKRVSGLLCKRVDFSMHVKRIEAIIPDISFTDYKQPKKFPFKML